MYVMLVSLARMLARACNVSLESTRLCQEMLRAATVSKVNIQQQWAPHPMDVKIARRIPMHLRRATRKQTVSVMPDLEHWIFLQVWFVLVVVHATHCRDQHLAQYRMGGLRITATMQTAYGSLQPVIQTPRSRSHSLRLIQNYTTTMSHSIAA